MERPSQVNLKRHLGGNDKYGDVESICKLTQRILTKEEFYGLEKDFFGNLVRKNRLKIGKTEWNFDRDKILQDYQKQLDIAKAVEESYAKEKVTLREAFAFRERRRMIPEKK